MDEFFGFDIGWTSIENLRHLADGGMCHVYAGELHGKQVALKYPIRDSDKYKLAIADLEKELQLLQLMQHPNILHLFGAGKTPQGDMFICLEYLTGGTLAKYLGTDAIKGGIPFLDKLVLRTLYMSFADAVKHAGDIAAAVAYMHNDAMPGAVIMHRDLKSSNLAFAKDGTIKVFDFGLAKVLREKDRSSVYTDKYMLTGQTGSLRYMAPEVALNEPYNEKADVYSLSILIWELLSSERPFTLHNVEDMHKRVIHGDERPQLDSRWPEPLQQLLQQCWSSDASARPDARYVEAAMKALYAELQSR